MGTLQMNADGMHASLACLHSEAALAWLQSEALALQHKALGPCKTDRHNTYHYNRGSSVARQW